MLIDIDHVQIAMPIGGEELARAFYSGVLGLAEIGKPQALQSRGGVWFMLGDKQIHLGVQRDFLPAKKAHIAFLSVAVYALRDKLTAAGYPVIEDELLP